MTPASFLGAAFTAQALNVRVETNRQGKVTRRRGDRGGLSSSPRPPREVIHILAFLRPSSFALRPFAIRPSRVASPAPRYTRRMQYVPLGPTGLRVSSLCLGPMTYGSRHCPHSAPDPAESHPS